MKVLLFLIAAVVALVGHGYFWVAIVNRMHGFAGSRKFKDTVTLTCMFGFLVMPLYVLLNGRAVFAQWHWSSVTVGVLAVRYFQGCLLMSLGELVVKTFWSAGRDDPETLLSVETETIENEVTSDRRLYRGTYPRFLGSIPGNQSTQLQIDRKKILVPRLGSAHEGLRIVHLSDFHMTGRLDVVWYEMIIEQVNRLQADVIVLTGDIVEHPDCVAWLEPTIGQLQAKYGVYFILGNHDKFVDTARTKMILASAGLICVSGQCVEATWNGGSVLLAGNERPWVDEAGEWPKRAGEHPPLRIGLQHTPDQWHWSIENDVDLALAGHTHGGQICFPLLGAVACPSLYGTRYAAGVFREGNCVMHVTRGLSGRTPLRWLCPPEIAVLELHVC